MNTDYKRHIPYLGVAHRAYVTRADVNTSIHCTAIAPAAIPRQVLTGLTQAIPRYGIFEWNGASQQQQVDNSINKIPTL